MTMLVTWVWRQRWYATSQLFANTLCSFVVLHRFVLAQLQDLIVEACMLVLLFCAVQLSV